MKREGFEFRTWPYGTCYEVTVMAADFSAIAVITDQNEGHILINHGVTEFPKPYTRAVITFVEGGATGGRWVFEAKTHAKREGRARLSGLRTADGFWSMRTEKGHIGKTYRVDLDSTRRMKFTNVEHQADFECEVIDVWDDDARGFMQFPTELLEIQP